MPKLSNANAKQCQCLAMLMFCNANVPKKQVVAEKREKMGNHGYRETKKFYLLLILGK